MKAERDLRHIATAAGSFSSRRYGPTQSFSALLDDVYERFPDYAANSIFRRAT